jgi:hypothetical protein
VAAAAAAADEVLVALEPLAAAAVEDRRPWSEGPAYPAKAMPAERTLRPTTRGLVAEVEKVLPGEMPHQQLAQPEDLARAVPLTQFQRSIPQEVQARHTT